MDNYNYQGFDITSLVEQFKGKKLEELFQNHEIVSNEMGQFMKIMWEEKFPKDLNLLVTRKRLLHNLKTVYYIGEKIERKLQRKGVKTLFDLNFNLRYKDSASHILSLINNKDYKTLSRNKYVRDLDLLFCFNKEDLLFLDIETLGLYDSPMIIIGVGFFRNDKFEINLFFARDLEEEIAICDHFKDEILPVFKCFISYNGKSFDIPYIANRFLYFFDENPMISEDETPYKISNSRLHHIDLYHNCRRKYKGQFENYTLTNMEEKLLNLKRENELPSNLVGTCYKKYKKDPIKYIGLIKECIEHNFFDVHSMPFILKKILDEF